MLKKALFTIAIFTLFLQSAYSDFPVPYNQSTDLSFHENAIFDLPDNNTMIVRVNPEKPKALYPFEIMVDFTNPTQIINVSVDLNMTMDMGDFNYKLGFQNNQYNRILTLPRCGSGRTKWYAKITVKLLDNTQVEKYMFFDVI